MAMKVVLVEWRRGRDEVDDSGVVAFQLIIRKAGIFGGFASLSRFFELPFCI